MSVLGRRLTGSIPRATEPLFGSGGQSNMLGAAVAVRSPLPLPWRAYAGLDAATWPADLDVVQWCYLRTRSGNHHGLEYGLANAAIAAGRSPTIVKTAVNGSGLGNSVSASWNKAAGEIYAAALAAILEGQVLAGKPCDSYIWNQGEHDANVEALADAYFANLVQYFADLRTDLGAPNMRAIICRLHADATVGFPLVIRAAQEAFVAADSNAQLVNVDDLELNDGVHLTSAAYDTLGARCWAAHVA